MPLPDRIKCPRTQILGFLGRQVFPHPGLAHDDANDCAASAVNPWAAATAANVA
jgi:hypothetical protein